MVARLRTLEIAIEPRVTAIPHVRRRHAAADVPANERVPAVHVIKAGASGLDHATPQHGPTHNTVEPVAICSAGFNVIRM